KAELLAAHGGEWKAGIPAWVRSWAEFRRGILSHATLTAEQLLGKGAPLRKRFPFDSLRLLQARGKIKALLKAGLLDGLHHLDLHLTTPTNRELLSLFEHPGLAEIRSLAADFFSPEAQRAFAKSPNLTRL